MRKQLTAFQRALVCSVLKEYADIPENKNIPDAFSDDFKQWIETCRRKNRVGKFRVVTIAKRILIAAILAALLAGTAMAIPAIQEAVIKFFIHEDDIQIGITFDPEQAATAPKEIEKTYTITYAPDTFILIADDAERSMVIVWFVNEKDELIAFTQNPMPDYPDLDHWLGLDAEGAQRKTVLMNGYLVEIISADENYKLVWTNNEYLFTLELPYSVNEEELQKIFASWGPRE